MQPILAVVTVLAATLFSGAALYINLVEHPARMRCGAAAALAEWAPSYRRAARMQASLAVIAAVGGVATWLVGGAAAWLVGAVLIGSVVPFTFVVIMPVNRALLEPGVDAEAASPLLERWNRLHAVRTALGLAASVVFVVALAGPQLASSG